MEKNLKKNTYLNHSAVHLKLIQHCKINCFNKNKFLIRNKTEQKNHPNQRIKNIK